MEARQSSMQKTDPNDKSQAEQRPMRIFCKRAPELNMAVHGNKVILVRADSNDKSQHWFQDFDAVGKLTDDEGRRAFALVSRTTGQAMVKRYDRQTTSVYDTLRLVPYNGDVGVEVSMLWSMGKELSGTGGYAEIRTLRDLSTTLNALGGTAEEGTLVGMHPSEAPGPNTMWKIHPIADQLSVDTPDV